jgi:hypothetical protein
VADYAYIAFLDILGYKNLLEHDIKNGTQIFKGKMIAAFRVLDTVNQAKFAHKVISDSIFISCSDRDAAPELMEILSNVFIAFLETGLLIRGGVSYGEHFQNQTITYSPALTKAYLLESTIAEFPRIMVDQNIVDMFPKLKNKNTILRSGDNWYLNIADRENYDRIWGFAMLTYEANIDQVNSNEKVRMKHRWLQDFLLEIGEVMGVKKNEKYIRMFDLVKDVTNEVEVNWENGVRV